jgi:DNA-binding transcriptional ArsR family regulator
MLRLARDHECTATELARAADLSPSAASQHLKLLREVGLMHVRVDAKRRLYRVDFERLTAVREVLNELWDTSLDALKQQAERSERPRRRTSRREGGRSA